MLLAVDIGNTNISFAVLKGEKVIHKISSPQSDLRENKKHALDILKKMGIRYPKLRRAVICSVVPNVLKIIKSSIKECFNIDAMVIGEDICVPIKNKYYNPAQVGQDRLLCAYAAKCLYGYPVIVIDLGTAITLDVVSLSGSYEGGIIIPGIRLSIESLHRKTAMLPLVELIKSPKKLIGKSTEESILSGVFNGYGAMCANLIDSLSQEFPQKPKVIVTGGHTQLMKKYISEKITKIDSSLVFKGMYLLSKK